MKIKELIEKKQPGTYAGVHFNDETKDALMSFIKENKIPNPPPKHKMHTTLLYSRTPCPNYKPRGEINPAYVGKPGQYNIWESQPDEDGNKTKCLVMEFDCPELNKRHEYLMKEHGASFDYDEYKTHVTLSYDVGDMDIKDLPKFDKSLEITEEYYEPLDLDWAKANTEK